MGCGARSARSFYSRGFGAGRLAEGGVGAVIWRRSRPVERRVLWCKGFVLTREGQFGTGVGGVVGGRRFWSGLEWGVL